MRNIIFGVVLVLSGFVVLGVACYSMKLDGRMIGLFVGLMAGAAFHLVTGIRKLQAAKPERPLLVEPVDDD